MQEMFIRSTSESPLVITLLFWPKHDMVLEVKWNRCFFLLVFFSIEGVSVGFPADRLWYGDLLVRVNGGLSSAATLIMK